MVMREGLIRRTRREMQSESSGGIALQSEVLTDEELAARAASGDQQATEALFERYFDRVYDLAYGMVRNRETAADVAQSTFLKVMEHLKKSSPPRGFTPLPATRRWMSFAATNGLPHIP